MLLRIHVAEVALLLNLVWDFVMCVLPLTLTYFFLSKWTTSSAQCQPGGRVSSAVATGEGTLMAMPRKLEMRSQKTGTTSPHMQLCIRENEATDDELDRSSVD